jgi:hypothetical protein
MNREIPRYEDTLSEEEFVSQLAPQSEQMMTPMDQQPEAQPEPMMSQQPPMPQQAAPQMPAQPQQPPMPKQPPMPQQQASPAEFNPFPPPSPNKPIGQAQPPVDINSLLSDYDSLVKPMRKLDKGEISQASIMNKASQVQDPALKNELISIAKYPQEAIRNKKFSELLPQYKELESKTKQSPSSINYKNSIDRDREQKLENNRSPAGSSTKKSINKDKEDMLSSKFNEYSGDSSSDTFRHIYEAESGAGKFNKIIEGIGMTKGNLHITRDTAITAVRARPELSEEIKSLVKKDISQMTPTEFMNFTAKNPEMEAKLAGAFVSDLYNGLRKKGVNIDGLEPNQKASIIGNLYNFPNQPKLINAVKEYSLETDPDRKKALAQKVISYMDATKVTENGMLVESEGLKARREKEKNLFMTPYMIEKTN